jgi:hypothetical protein
MFPLTIGNIFAIFSSLKETLPVSVMVLTIGHSTTLSIVKVFNNESEIVNFAFTSADAESPLQLNSSTVGISKSNIELFIFDMIKILLAATQRIN